MRVALCSALALCSFALPGMAQTPEQQTTIPVGVVQAARQSVAQSADFVGRVDAVNRVEVRARVTGFIEGIEFKEGDAVAPGAALYRIEKDLFQAAVDQAEGVLGRSKAAQTLTAIQRQRAEDLLAKASGTAVARDQAQAADEQAKAQIQVDQANLDTAKINLGYTDITAPVAGKIGKTNVTLGNVVGPESGPLTVIVSQDPIYVSFPVSQSAFLRAQAQVHRIDVAGIKVALRFSDGHTYSQEGAINFVDVKVDRTTDTRLVRATFPNPKSELVDGQLVRVNLESGSSEEKVVVPQVALIADQEGTYVFVIDNGKAAVRRVKTGGEAGAGIVIEEGLSGGEQVIVEGLQGVRPGVAVRATPIPQTLDRS